MIVQGHSADHNGWSYIVRITKTGRLITFNYKIHPEDSNNDRTVPQKADLKTN